ncbi:MAG: hypothetical protein AB7F86_12270 [Bdellovibrionales bacterium]
MRKNKRWILNLFLCLVVAAGCSARHSENPKGPSPSGKVGPATEVMSPYTYLRKVSMHVRGITPSRQEYADLAKAVENGQQEAYFDQRLQYYLASSEHIDKMIFRLEELFQLKPSGVSYYSPLKALAHNQTDFPDFPFRNSLNDLFREVVARNLPWDHLLLGKSYQAYDLGECFFTTYLSDKTYYSALQRSEPGVPTSIRFAEDDPRVAGAITTSRFFGRYSNTALNKNRRRAAAIFNIFLCDDMKAVVVDEKDKQDQVLDRVFPTQPGAGGNKQSGTNQHGTDPACLKCHYKLDPMGQTLQQSGLILSPFASPGALVFTDSQQRRVHQDVKGLGGLAVAIASQPDYLDCQIRHFWRWFVGVDKDLSSSRLTELRTTFEKLGRRPNDFIAYLLHTEEFGHQSGDGSNAQIIADVRRTLGQCNGCHAARTRLPSFTDWPIGGSESSHLHFLAEIKKSLGLDGSSKSRTMPPPSSVWQPSSAELENLSRWFEMGAPRE